MTILQNTVAEPNGKPLDGWVDIEILGNPFQASSQTELLGALKDHPIVGGSWAVELVPGLYTVTQRRRDGLFHSRWTVQVPASESPVWVADCLVYVPSTPPAAPLLGIAALGIDEAGHLQITYTNGDQVDAGMVKGPPGDPSDLTAADISDSTAIGRTLMTAEDDEAARQAIGSVGLTLAELDERYALKEQAPPPPPPVSSTFDVDDVVYTTGYGAPLRTDGKFPGWGRHELELGITAAYDWRHGARPGVPGPPWPAEYKGITGYDHHNVWGEAIPVAGGMPAAHRNVRAQVDRPQVLHLEGSAWLSKKDPADIDVMDGGYWDGGPDGYTKTVDWPSTESNPYWRTETIGHSFDCAPMTNADGTVKVNTSIAHWFYPEFFPRIPIAAGAHVAIVTRMRLISDDPGVDLEQAKILARISGDAFTDANVSVGAGGKNPALVMPRHVLLGPDWRWVAIVTGTEAQIRAMPPMPFLVP